MHERKVSADVRSKQQRASLGRTEQGLVMEGQIHLAGEMPRPRKRGIGDSDEEAVDGDGDGDGEGDEDGEGGNPGFKSRRRRRCSGTKDGPPRWACPFWKHDPLRNVACSSYTLKRVQDVKQHLLRKHRRRCLYCPICLREFTTVDQRDSHIIERKCRAADLTAHGGAASASYMTPDKEDKLRARMSGPDTEIWYRIWKILFDDAKKPPSPHQGNIIEEVAGVLNVFWNQHHQEIVSDVIAGLGSSEASVVEEHLPRLMSTALGDLIDLLTQVTHKTSDSAPSSPGSSNVTASDPNISALPYFSLPHSPEPPTFSSIEMGSKFEDFFGPCPFLESGNFFDDLDSAVLSEP